MSRPMWKGQGVAGDKIPEGDDWRAHGDGCPQLPEPATVIICSTSLSIPGGSGMSVLVQLIQKLLPVRLSPSCLKSGSATSELCELELEK